jgi:hypothetical protein
MNKLNIEMHIWCLELLNKLNIYMYTWCLEPLNKLNTEMYIGANSGSPEGSTVHAPYVTLVVLLYDMNIIWYLIRA